MSTPQTTPTGPVESQTTTNERRLAEERLRRFLESVREMDQFIKEQRGGQSEPEKK